MSSSSAQETFECGICFETYPEDSVAKIDRCNHQYCQECMSTYLMSKLEERRSPIVCPVCSATDGRTDPGVIGEEIARQVGLTQAYQRWNELGLANSSVIAQCPKCNVFVVVDRDEYESTGKVSCPRQGCRDYRCKKCSKLVRLNEKHTCGGSIFFRFWKRRVRDDTAQLDKLIKKKKWKRCPGCQTPMEKTEGCNHMICIAPECRTHFCYRCGGLMLDPGLHDCR